MPIGSTPDMLVVLDDHPNSRAGLTIAQRYARGIVTLAAWDVATDHIDGEVRTSVTAEPSIAEALRVATRRRAPWVAIRRDFAEPEQLLGELLVAAAQHVEDDIPGFAVLLADGDPPPFRRILGIVDRGAGPISGLLAYIAIAIADASGAELDVLVLGSGRTEVGAIDSSTMLAVNREQELFERARARGHAAGMTVNWITLTTDADRWTIVADQLGQHDYDLIIDDLGDISLGRQGSPERAVEAASGAGQVGEIPLRLLREVPVPLLLVIDEIRLGIAPTSVLKLGTAAAIALGMVSTAALTSSASPVVAQTSAGSAPEELAQELAVALGLEQDPQEAAAAQAQARAEQAADSSRGGGESGARAEASPVAQAASLAEQPAEAEMATDAEQPVEAEMATDAEQPADEVEAEKEKEKAKPKPPKGGADPEDVRKAERAAAKDKEALEKDRKQKEKAKKSVAEAEESFGAAQEAAEAALAELNAATLAYAEAEQHAEKVQSETSGISAILPGGPDEIEVLAAQQWEQAAQQRLELAMTTGTQALDNLDAAEAELVEAEATLAKRAEEAKETKGEYQEAKAKVEVFRKSLAKTRQSPVASGYNLTARYGNTGGYWSSGIHTGLDFAGPAGTDILAAASGTVVHAGWEGSYGNKIVIDHGNGYETAYSHLSDIDVRVGQKVQTGDHIGDMGSTGNSTGSHLHFEVMKNGKFMDPEDWLGW